MYNNKAITSNDAVRNKFQLELANRFENLQLFSKKKTKFLEKSFRAYLQKNNNNKKKQKKNWNKNQKLRYVIKIWQNDVTVPP